MHLKIEWQHQLLRRKELETEYHEYVIINIKFYNYSRKQFCSHLNRPPQAFSNPVTTQKFYHYVPKNPAEKWKCRSILKPAHIFFFTENFLSQPQTESISKTKCLNCCWCGKVHNTIKIKHCVRDTDKLIWMNIQGIMLIGKRHSTKFIVSFHS